jgi:hypothetical protein
VRRNLGRGDSEESSSGDGQEERGMKGRIRGRVSIKIGKGENCERVYEPKWRGKYDSTPFLQCSLTLIR